MKRPGFLQGVLALLVFSLILFVVLLRRPVVVSGTEFGYVLPPGTSTELEDGVRGRIAALGFLEGEVTREGELLVIRLPDAKPGDVADVKRLIRRRGRLEFRPTADREVQEKFKKDGLLPEGYEAVPHDRKDVEYLPWTPAMLIRKTCALEGGRVVRAEAQSQLMPGSRDWYVAFDLDSKGSKKFDETAELLFARRPPGLLAVLLDGKLVMAPAVQTNQFGGSGQITGVGGEREAKDLAIVLASGALPVPLEGEPQFERPFQKTR